SLAGNTAIASRLRVVPAPLIVSSPAVAAALREEAAVREVLELAQSAVVTLTGIGSAHPEEASAVRSGVLTSADVARFMARGAVGDMLGEWFDIRGNIVAEATSDRRIGLGLDTLRGMDNVVGVAGGPDKVNAILGAVAGRFIKVLITDEPTAQALLEAVPPRRVSPAGPSRKKRTT
ncbi:MAG: sugar-binding domain-containing protein, partial [Propionibacteriaceae bacterium]|nr:sugar-binding domain-containing protein [Propionibacteriaceae bacterium]